MLRPFFPEWDYDQRATTILHNLYVVGGDIENNDDFDQAFDAAMGYPYEGERDLDFRELNRISVRKLSELRKLPASWHRPDVT